MIPMPFSLEHEVHDEVDQAPRAVDGDPDVRVGDLVERGDRVGEPDELLRAVHLDRAERLDVLALSDELDDLRHAARTRRRLRPDTSTWAAVPSSSNSVSLLSSGEPELVAEEVGGVELPDVGLPGGARHHVHRLELPPSDSPPLAAAVIAARGRHEGEGRAERDHRMPLLHVNPPSRSAEPPLDEPSFHAPPRPLMAHPRLPSEQPPLDDPRDPHHSRGDDRDEEDRPEQRACRTSRPRFG